jgi:hypothetical protein
LEDLDAEVDINSSWETLRESIKNLAKNGLPKKTSQNAAVTGSNQNEWG